MEYRIENIILSGSQPEADQIVARLNQLAVDGWRVGAIDLAGHPSYSSRAVAVLLERGEPGGAARVTARPDAIPA